MRLLVLGSGGREHAILWTLRGTSARQLELYCAPGNAGIAEIAECLPIPIAEHAKLIEFVQAKAIDLTVIGPEAPLAAGIVDAFESHRLAIVGPSRAASRLESSKVFAKQFMSRHKIPTADFRVVGSLSEAREVLQSGFFGSDASPTVVKADGLAAGKGVVVANSRTEAEQAVTELVSGSLVDSDAAKQIVLEQTLVGIEASVLLFADGRDYALMPAARDHKRIGENDTGPNTGGMGAVTDSSILETEMLKRVVREIVEPTLEGARAEGFSFRGVLFLGLMLTTDGPKLLEYNVRFGDPETQAILLRLKTSLADILSATRTGGLGNIKVDWTHDSSACVVMASEGYPARYQTGFRIEGLENVSPDEYVKVFHAGTSRSDKGEFLTAGGRVLGVTARGDTLEKALDRCYKTVGKIKWDGVQFRRDIGRFREASTKAGG